jgi:hypothetical protein
MFVAIAAIHLTELCRLQRLQRLLDKSFTFLLFSTTSFIHHIPLSSHELPLAGSA